MLSPRVWRCRQGGSTLWIWNPGGLGTRYQHGRAGPIPRAAYGYRPGMHRPCQPAKRRGLRIGLWASAGGWPGWAPWIAQPATSAGRYAAAPSFALSPASASSRSAAFWPRSRGAKDRLFVLLQRLEPAFDRAALCPKSGSPEVGAEDDIAELGDELHLGRHRPFRSANS